QPSPCRRSQLAAIPPNVAISLHSPSIPPSIAGAFLRGHRTPRPITWRRDVEDILLAVARGSRGGRVDEQVKKRGENGGGVVDEQNHRRRMGRAGWRYG